MKFISNAEVSKLLANNEATSECSLGGEGREENYQHIVCLSHENRLFEPEEEIDQETIDILEKESQEAYTVKKDYFDVEVA